MPIDAKALSTEINDQLTRIGEACYDFLERPSYRSDVWATLNLGPHHAQPHVHASAMGFSLNKSNHRKMQEAQFVQERRKDLEAFAALVRRVIPALDHEGFWFQVELRDPSKDGHPRCRIDFFNHQLSSGPVRSITLARKIAQIAEIMDGVEKPGTRTFLVNDQPIPAVDAYAAVRLYSALSFPGIFKNPPATTPSIIVAEKLDPTPLFFPIFREAEAA